MDIIEAITKGLGKMIAKIFLSREEKSSVKIDIQHIRKVDVVKSLLKRLYYEGSYNKAENLIFDELEKNYSDEVYDAAIDFYGLLLNKDDEELNKNDFSREEIYRGIEDIKKFKDIKATADRGVICK